MKRASYIQQRLDYSVILKSREHCSLIYALKTQREKHDTELKERLQRTVHLAGKFKKQIQRTKMLSMALEKWSCGVVGFTDVRV